MGLKLPPYFDPSHFDHVAKVINKYPDTIKFITCINSLGNGLVIDPETDHPVIYPKGGLGGIGGDYCKPIALANVYQFYQRLDIPIIGCGGVKHGTDVYEHIMAGASLVQIGTQLVKEGPGCFKRIEREFLELIEKKGYSKIEDFRGKIML